VNIGGLFLFIDRFQPPLSGFFHFQKGFNIMSLSSRLAEAKAHREGRHDGYSQEAANALCQFQMWAERQPNCDYACLREVLTAARGQSYSFETLCQMYLS
jgi:hypothetical protein